MNTPAQAPDFHYRQDITTIPMSYLSAFLYLFFITPEAEMEMEKEGEEIVDKVLLASKNKSDRKQRFEDADNVAKKLN